MKVRCALSTPFFARWKHFLGRALEGTAGLQHSGTWDFSAVTEWKSNIILVKLEPTIPAPWADALSVGPQDLLARGACTHPIHNLARAVLGIEPDLSTVKVRCALSSQVLPGDCKEIPPPRRAPKVFSPGKNLLWKGASDFHSAKSGLLAPRHFSHRPQIFLQGPMETLVGAWIATWIGWLVYSGMTSWEVLDSIPRTALLQDRGWNEYRRMLPRCPVAQWIRHRPTEPGIVGLSPTRAILFFHSVTAEKSHVLLCCKPISPSKARSKSAFTEWKTDMTSHRVLPLDQAAS